MSPSLGMSIDSFLSPLDRGSSFYLPIRLHISSDSTKAVIKGVRAESRALICKEALKTARTTIEGPGDRKT